MLCAVVAGCAFKVAPDGGPRDTTPPTLVGSSPASGTTSFRGTSVDLRFSTYIDRSVTQAITVQPATRIRTSYAGDEISIAFLEPLLPNTTYSVTLGTSWSDVRGNRPASAYGIIFSTGVDIDTGSVTGIVQGASLDNTVVFCQRMQADATTDTAYAPRRTPARYRIPIGSTGAFTVRGLADGRYRLLAVRDANRNGMVDAGEDLGTATRDAVIAQGSTDTVTMTLAPARDRVAPTITRVRALNERVTHVTFSERIDSSDLSVDAVSIVDSMSVPQAVDAVWNVADRADVMAVRTTTALRAGRYTLRVRPGAIRDSAGLTMVDTAAQTFNASATAYEARQRIRSMSLADSARNVPLPFMATLLLDHPPATSMPINVSLRRDSVELPVTVTTRGARLDVGTEAPLAPAGAYTLRIDIGSDTTLRRTFTTAERIDPGTANGRLIDEARIASSYILRCLDEKKRPVRNIVVRDGDSVSVDALPPATYGFDAFVDVNGNGQFDAGTEEPWTFGEPKLPVRATVTIRPRWTVDGLRIVLPRSGSRP